MNCLRMNWAWLVVVGMIVSALALAALVNWTTTRHPTIKHVCVIRLSTGQELTIERCTVTP